jgi:predicted dehydrogenase
MNKTINWALAGTGGITNSFVRGLAITKGANLLAVASRSKENAEKFASKYGAQLAYGSFDAMLDNRDIDVVYLGVPHTAHKELALKAFQAGKAVLCEKPVAVNAEELAQMIASARKYNVFFMEAMWSRFVPPVRKAREWLQDGLIGEARLVQGNFGFKANVPPENRLRNINLGGGSLLDAGVYPVSFASMVFGGTKPRKISSVLSLGETGVDEDVAALIDWGSRKTAFVSAAISLSTENDFWIYGTEGTVRLPSFVFCRSADLTLPGKTSYHWEGDFRGNGYNYEAKAVMDCLREGRKECDIMPLDESLVIAEIMDEIRRQGGLKYPGESAEVCCGK